MSMPLMVIDILAIGSPKNASLEALTQTYLKRLMRWRVVLTYFDIKGVSDEGKRQQREGERLLEALDALKDKVVIVMDQRGKALSSADFSETLAGYEQRGLTRVVFLLGGAHGFIPEVVQRADQSLSFGPATWPHLMARLMLTEQLYRAQQILTGHPYHQDA